MKQHLPTHWAASLVVPILLCETALAVPVEEAEVHLLVCGVSTPDLLQELDLAQSDAEQHDLYFADTPSLELLDAGLILRVTAEPDADKVEFDVKLRPIDPTTLDPSWDGTSGFKCEVDSTPAGTATACRLRNKPAMTVWRRVLGCDAPFTSIWSGKQRQLVTEVFGELPGSGAPSIYGPLSVSRWDFDAGDAEVTLEVWPLAQDMIELSTRVPTANIQAGHARLAGFAAAAGGYACAEQGSKTRRALTYLVGMR